MRKLAGMRLTADVLNDNTADEETTSGLTAAANFSVAVFSGRKVNGVTTVQVVVTYSGTTITGSSSGNITDTLCATLPSGWRPQETITTSFDRGGTADGSCTILTDGTCTLKSLSPTATIPAGGNVSFNGQWISENL